MSKRTLSKTAQTVRDLHRANEPAYFAYLDTLYGRHGVTGPKQGLADLIPRLSANERIKLADLMVQAGYDFEGLTDQY